MKVQTPASVESTSQGNWPVISQIRLHAYFLQRMRKAVCCHGPVQGGIVLVCCCFQGIFLLEYVVFCARIQRLRFWWGISGLLPSWNLWLFSVLTIYRCSSYANASSVTKLVGVLLSSCKPVILNFTLNVVSYIIRYIRITPYHIKCFIS